MKGDAHASNVVNFLQFRANRERGRLPLFDDAPARRSTSGLAELTPNRTLKPADVEHRARMLRHLAESRTP